MTELIGTGRLVRLALRRDRVRLTIWVVFVLALTLVAAYEFTLLYADGADRAAAVTTLDSPAGLAFSGPVRYLRGVYTYGSMLGHQMVGYTVVLVGIMSVLTVVRHTRTEEQTGRAELVLASNVGRHAHLASALVVAAIANLAIAVLLTLSLGAAGMEGVTWSGSVLYGAAHLVGGLVFAALAAVTAQVTEHPRAAAGLALTGVGLAYLVRAMGDASDGTLSWLSPVGWTQLTYVYVENRWWPLLLAVVLTAGLIAAAVALSARRDFGAGLRRPRQGREHASPGLLQPLGLAVRLHRGLLIGYGAGVAFLAIGYGGVLGDADAMLEGIEVLEDAFAEVGGASIAESFASIVFIFVAAVTSGYLVLAALRPKGEETAGRAEPILACAVSRSEWLGGHVVAALAGGALMMVSAGVFFGLAGAASMGDTSVIADLVVASVAYVPALWVTAGVALVLYGFAPRATPLAWVVPIYGFIATYIGSILQFPQWLMDLSPFGHVPRLPAEPWSWLPFVLTLLVAAALVAAGFAGFRRRDLAGTV